MNPKVRNRCTKKSALKNYLLSCQISSLNVEFSGTTPRKICRIFYARDAFHADITKISPWIKGGELQTMLGLRKLKAGEN